MTNIDFHKKQSKLQNGSIDFEIKMQTKVYTSLGSFLPVGYLGFDLFISSNLFFRIIIYTQFHGHKIGAEDLLLHLCGNSGFLSR